MTTNAQDRMRSITTRPNRAALAREIATLAESYGISASVNHEPTFAGDRVTLVDISHSGGARLTVRVDGASRQPTVFLLSWHMASESDATYAAKFCAAINQFHRRKATDVCGSVSDLLGVLAVRFSMLEDGSAYGGRDE